MGSPAIFKGRRTKLLTANGLELSNNAVIDNDGLRNYIANGHAEVSTVGWATYADAAGPEPVNGTGGSPVITWTRSTSSPLRGQASFVLTKDAANRQGEGVSYDFKIDRADLSGPLQISFNYEIGSGTFAAGDITVWVYRVDATAALIQPSAYQLDGVVVGQQYQFRGEFQADSDADDYRLILHIASTSASAYTLKVDDVIVGPSKNIGGSIITEWSLDAYDITYEAMGTVTANEVKTRRVGDTLHVSGSFTQGTSAASTAAIVLPGGLGIDFTKWGASTDLLRCGTWGVMASAGPSNLLGADQMPFQLFSDGSDVSRIFFARDTASSAFVKNNGSDLGSGVTVVFEFEVPIVGWGAAGILGQDSDTRVAAVSLTYNSGPQVISTGSFQTITWDTVVKDTHGAWNSGTKQITVPVSGWYTAYSMVEYAASIAGSDRRVSLFVNGVEGPTLSYLPPAFASTVTQQGSATVYLEAGDLVDPRFRQDSGGNLNIALSGPTVNHFELVRMSGPAQVAASEVVAARYTGTAGSQTVNDSTVTIVDFPTKSIDTHSTVTTGSSWKFEAPAPGIYEVSAVVPVDGNTAGIRTLSLYKNGALYTVLLEDSSPPATTIQLHGTDLVQLNAGDEIDVRIFQDSGGFLLMGFGANFTKINVRKVQ